VVSITPRLCFTPGKRTLGTHWTWSWVGPRAGLDAETRRKILCLCRGSNPPVVQSVVRHYTAWATAAHWNVMEFSYQFRARTETFHFCQIMLVFWVVTPCRLEGRYQHFGGMYCLHLQGRRWYLPTSTHGVTTQKTNIGILPTCDNRLGQAARHRTAICGSCLCWETESVTSVGCFSASRGKFRIRVPPDWATILPLRFFRTYHSRVILTSNWALTCAVCSMHIANTVQYRV
jgi:hypothetical protein